MSQVERGLMERISNDLGSLESEDGLQGVPSQEAVVSSSSDLRLAPEEEVLQEPLGEPSEEPAPVPESEPQVLEEQPDV